MQPLVRAALAAAFLAALGSLGKTPKAPPPPPEKASSAPGIRAACGPRTLPEGSACLPLPRPGEALLAAVGAMGAMGEAADDEDHRGASAGRVLVPRRPERPAAASAYRFPLADDATQGPPVVLAGLDRRFDLGAAAEGAAAGPGAVFLGAAAGDEVVALSLEDQEGPAEVAFVGDMVGATIITAHLVRDGGKLRQVLLVHGNLGAFGAELAEGVTLEPDEVLGAVGDSAWPGRPGLYLEALELREGTSLGGIDAARLRDDILSVPCDLRNRLPLR